MNYENYGDEYTKTYGNAVSKDKVNAFMATVYGWMFLALLVTGATAYFTLHDANLFMLVVKNFKMFLLLELGVVFAFSMLLNRVNMGTAALMFFAYSILNGLTISIIVLQYTASSVTTVFLLTASLFGIMSLFGYVTKKSLDSIGKYALLALLGIIIASVINWFMKSPSMYWIISYVGIVVFIALTAYDTQKIKRKAASMDINNQYARKYAIYGALELYLDFINLFLLLLRTMGKRR
jgi:FtsH-binding integral membrane protein